MELLESGFHHNQKALDTYILQYNRIGFSMITTGGQTSDEAELLKKLRALMDSNNDEFIKNITPPQKVNEKVGPDTAIADPVLIRYMTVYRSEYEAISRQCLTRWDWIEDVQRILEDLNSTLISADDSRISISVERDNMMEKLSILDSKCRDLIEEKQSLVKEVDEIQENLDIHTTLRDGNVLVLNRELIITDPEFFESILIKLNNLKINNLKLFKNFESLKNKIISTSLEVGTEAIDVYTRRMVGVPYEMINEQFTGTLNCVETISRIFSNFDSDYISALVELERLFVEARERIVMPRIGETISKFLGEFGLPNGFRKSFKFILKLTENEKKFQNKFFPLPRHEGVMMTSILSGFYASARGGVIHSDNIPELKEICEIIRLEFPEFNNSILIKLFKDISEKLIFLIEKEITLNPSLSLVSSLAGIVDPQTFREISHEAVNAYIDSLFQRRFESEEVRLLEIIKGLLGARDQVTGEGRVRDRIERELKNNSDEWIAKKVVEIQNGQESIENILNKLEKLEINSQIVQIFSNQISKNLS